MESGPALILRTLDRHLTGPGHVRLFGGAAFVLGYGRSRTTDDADLLLDDRECQALIDDAGFSEAIESTNRELEPRGLYLPVILVHRGIRVEGEAFQEGAAPRPPRREAAAREGLGVSAEATLRDQPPCRPCRTPSPGKTWGGGSRG